MAKLKDGREVELELFKSDGCFWCARVLGKLKQLGRLDAVTLRDTWREPGAGEELVRRGGMRQVPCLFIAGEPLYESADINAWLEANLA